jgi:hypothetical protein
MWNYGVEGDCRQTHMSDDEKSNLMGPALSSAWDETIAANDFDSTPLF